jgi:uncharacterized protein (DUF305 family)
VAGFVLVGALLAGCGSAPDGGPRPAGGGPMPAGSATAGGTASVPADAAFNATDVMFLQMMLEQHAAAERLIALAADRPLRPELATLAAAIEVTQRTETETMTGWLRDWGQPVTVDPAAHLAHGAHGGSQVLRGSRRVRADLPQHPHRAPAQRDRVGTDGDRRWRASRPEGPRAPDRPVAQRPDPTAAADGLRLTRPGPGWSTGPISPTIPINELGIPTVFPDR